MVFFSKSIISDEDLVARLRQGDEKAFTAIYERYHKLLYVLAWRYLKSPEAAEDAVQQVFLRLWESHPVLMVNVNLRNYLYTMIKNWVLNEIRNADTALEKCYEMAQESAPFEDELLPKLEEKEMRREIYQAIGQLPEQKRIAERMGISLPTVKSHYTQAIKMLRTALSHLFVLILGL